MSALKHPYSSFFLLSALFLFNCGFSQSRTEKIKAYIQKYKHIAIEQMAEFHIPASVIMAQAIKESGFGTSELAQATNNHFGIKCHKGWTGNTYNYDDDTPNECFRTYNSVEESFYDHSMFLASRPRYSFLFKLKITDHYNWCIGLKKAGYATAWNYTDELLLIIAVHHLNELDNVNYLASINASGELLTQPEKNIIEVSSDLQENYFTRAEKAILAKVIFNQMPAEEEPLLVRRNDSGHAE